MAYRKKKKRAKDHVLTNRVEAIDTYVRDLGIEDETLAAAIAYARWFAAAEYRLLQRQVSTSTRYLGTS